MASSINVAPHGELWEAALGKLERAATVGEFREAAREFLAQYPEHAHVVSRYVRKIIDAPGGPRLVQIVQQLERIWPRVAPSNRPQLLSRAFRSSNPTTTMPIAPPKGCETRRVVHL